jgi:hypothetical protein
MVVAPRVAVAVLNYNGLQWLKTCLPSVLRSRYQRLDVYVVDNGSTDGSVNYVESTYPTVKRIAFEKNLGYAGAYNAAVREIQADYIVLLNNDTIVLNDAWLEELVKHVASDTSVAAVGCKLVTMENQSMLDSVGNMGIKYWRGFVDIGKYERDKGQYDKPPVVPFSLCGAAMLVRKSAFEQIRGFDAHFHSYVEDVDLCWRWRLMNYQLLYEPSARVAHYYSGTAGAKSVNPRTMYLSNRNMLRAIIKNCGDSLLWALRTYLLFAALLILGYTVLEPEKAKAMLRALGWNLLNLKDTCAQRVLIQSTRKVKESEIIQSMYPNLPRYESNDYGGLRRFLNILFESRRRADQVLGDI